MRQSTLPAIQSSSVELTDVLKAGSREGYVRRSSLRSLLVVAQVALSVTLLVGALLFVRSLSNVRAIALGLDASRLMFARAEFETRDARRDSLTPVRLVEAAERLRVAPGIQATALTALRPMYLPLENMPFPDRPRVIAIRAEEAMAPAVTREVQRVLAREFPGGDVSQRTYEFGVRVALGAQVGDVIRNVLGTGLRVMVVGVAIDVALSLAAGKLVAALLYGVTPRDPAAISTVVVLLLAVAAVAALIPAWRASRVDPLTALRTE